MLKLLLRDPKIANLRSDEIIKLAQNHGLTGLMAMHSFTRGWGLVQAGNTEKGLVDTMQGHTELGRLPGTIPAALFSLIAGEVASAACRRQQGLEVVEAGLEIARSTGTGFSEAELHRLKGELLLIGNDSAAAEAAQCFREAIEVARRQSAKSWELRETTSLSRLLASQGNRDEARTMLGEIYNWFTEGFDTADLKDARALLEQLNI